MKKLQGKAPKDLKFPKEDISLQPAMLFYHYCHKCLRVYKLMIAAIILSASGC
jgi:hypothetical protein